MTIAEYDLWHEWTLLHWGDWRCWIPLPLGQRLRFVRQSKVRR